MTKAQRVAKVVRAANGAYSEDRYTPAGWAGAARKMIEAGFTDEQAEAVLRSKHMRWALDQANRRGHGTTADFIAYVTKEYGGLNTRRFATSLDKELLSIPVASMKSGSELAGACEGEDIAALIDLAQMVALGQAETTLGRMRISAKAEQILSRIEARS